VADLHRLHYVNAQGLVTHRFACTGRKVRVSRVLALSDAEAAELRAMQTVRSVALVPAPVVASPTSASSVVASKDVSAPAVPLDDMTSDDEPAGGEPPKVKRKGKSS
jgi:hypothetical protein